MTSLLNQLPTTAMADALQEQLFAIMSEHRTPFSGISRWPWWHDLLKARSQQILDQQGEAAWNNAGGRTDKDGQPSLHHTCDAAEEVLQLIERDIGGVLHRDSQGTAFAMKIESVQHNGRRSRFAYGLSWFRREPEGLDPVALDSGWSKAKEIWSCDDDRERQMLERMAQNIRLYRRAEQLLWLIHSQVLARRTSMIGLPDIVAAEAVWGPRHKWPPNWRQEIFETLQSLSWLHSSVLVFAGKGWQAAGKAHSVALSHVSLRPDCPKNCPLSGGGERHQHFAVQVGFGFLGVLEKYIVGRELIQWQPSERGDNELRIYDFVQEPVGEARKELQHERKAGQIITVHLPFKIYGPGRWSGLGARERKILSGLFREMTRTKTGDLLEVREGRVSRAQPKKKSADNSDLDAILCPCLAPHETYLVCGGNGSRRGCGYRAVGEFWTGWLAKCGYDCDQQADKALRPFARDWLDGLANLGTRLGVIPAAIHPQTGQWYDLAQMQELLRTTAGWKTFDRLHVRIYVPRDFAENVRSYLVRQAGRDGQETPIPVEHPGAQFVARMERLGLTQKNLAAVLGVSRPYVNRLLNSAKWSAERVQQTESWLTSEERKRATKK